MTEREALNKAITFLESMDGSTLLDDNLAAEGITDEDFYDMMAKLKEMYGNLEGA